MVHGTVWGCPHNITLKCRIFDGPRSTPHNNVVSINLSRGQSGKPDQHLLWFAGFTNICFVINLSQYNTADRLSVASRTSTSWSVQDWNNISPTALMQLCCHLANEYETRNQYASPPRVNAIPAGTLSDFDEILCRWWIPKAVRSLMSKILTSWVQKMWAIFAKNGKNFEFLANISRRGQIPLSDFYKIRHGGGCPRSVASRPTSRLWLLKCGHTGANFRQNAKIGNIWYKFGPNPLKRFL